MVSMEDLNQNPLSNDPDIQRANPPLNQAIQQVGTSPRSINPEVNTQPIPQIQPPPQSVGPQAAVAQSQPVVSVASANTEAIGNLDSKSNTKLFIVIGVVLAILLITLSLFFFVFSKSSKPSSANINTTRTTTTTTNNTQTPSTQPKLPAISTACLSTYNDKNLCQYFANLALSTVPHIEAFSDTSYYQGQAVGSAVTSTYETDGKGNSSYLFTQGEANITVGAIELNGNLYIKSPPQYNTWTELPSTTAEAQPGGYGTPPNINMTIAENSPGVTFKAGGTVSCDSLECYKYLVTNSSQPGIVQTIWFDNSNYLLRQWSYDTTQSPQAQSVDNNGGTPGSITTDTITYQPITITVPSN